MFETIVTVVGYVITEPRLRRTPGGNRVTSFRVVSTSRRFDKDSEEWVNGDQVFATVNCWHRLADGVAEEMRKSDPVVVTGRMRTRDYEVGGLWRCAVEIDANAIGLDLARQRRKDDPLGFRHDDPAGWDVGLRHDEPSAVREAELVGVGHGASVAAGRGVSTEASRDRRARAGPVPSAGAGRDRAAGGAAVTERTGWLSRCRWACMAHGACRAHGRPAHHRPCPKNRPMKSGSRPEQY